MPIMLYVLAAFACLLILIGIMKRLRDRPWEVADPSRGAHHVSIDVEPVEESDTQAIHRDPKPDTGRGPEEAIGDKPSSVELPAVDIALEFADEPERSESPPRVRIDTEKRGGSPRVLSGRLAASPITSEGTEAEAARKGRRSEVLRPEVVTWEHRGRQCVGLVLSVSETFSLSDCSARYAGSEEKLEPVGHAEASRLGFARTDSNESLCTINRLEPVIVRLGDITRHVQLDPNDLLLFRITGEKGRRGRRVRYISTGKYVAVCPATFEVAGEVGWLSCGVKNCRAFVMEVAETGQTLPEIALPTGERYQWSRKQAFSLEGTVFRSGLDQRDFFLGSAPVLVSPEPFKEGTTVVVGSEGPGRRRRFQTKLFARPGEMRLHLDDTCGDNAENPFKEETLGWFFARIYEDDDILMDSLDFVLVRSIKQISWEKETLFPGPEGHEPLYVRVTHDNSVTSAVDDFYTVEQTPSSTVIEIPPDPDYEVLTIRVKEGRKIHKEPCISVPINRLWYAVGDQSKEPLYWHDLPVSLSHEDFLANRRRVIWLKAPVSAAGKPFFVGFSESGAKRYTLSPAARKPFAIPLRDFYDQSELRSNVEGPVSMWIRDSDSDVSHCLALVQPRTPVQQYRACGRSKNVHAVAYLTYPGNGAVTCDGLRIAEFRLRQRRHKGLDLMDTLSEDPLIGNVLRSCSVSVATYGGRESTVRKCKAIAHSIANALKQQNPSLAPRLKKLGLGGAVLKKSGQRGSTNIGEM